MSGIINPADNKVWGQRFNRVDVTTILNCPRGAALPAVTADHEDGSLFLLTTTGVLYCLYSGTWDTISGGTVVFLGVYTTLAALQLAHPTAVAGQYAEVDAGVGSDVLFYAWDDDDDDWIQVGSGGVIPVKATAAELNTGTDDAKFATALALEDSKYINQNNTKNYAKAFGTDTYTASMTPALTSYVEGQEFSIYFTNANTGASTININGLGTKDIFKNTTDPVDAGNLTGFRRIAYDGTQFQVVGSSAAGGGGGGTWGTITGTLSDQTDLQAALNAKAGIAAAVGNNIFNSLNFR